MTDSPTECPAANSSSNCGKRKAARRAWRFGATHPPSRRIWRPGPEPRAGACRCATVISRESGSLDPFCYRERSPRTSRLVLGGRRFKSCLPIHEGSAPARRGHDHRGHVRNDHDQRNGGDVGTLMRALPRPHRGVGVCPLGDRTPHQDQLKEIDLMARIIITNERSKRPAAPVLAERVRPEHLSDEHSGAQIIERFVGEHARTLRRRRLRGSPTALS
jgi:hypothetical protein